MPPVPSSEAAPGAGPRASTPDGLLGHIRWLYAFHDWARPRLLGAARSLGASDLCRPGVIAGGHASGSMHAALAHVLGAEIVWYSRWQGEALCSLPAVADFPTLSALDEAWSDLEAARSAWLAGISGAHLACTIRYVSIARGTEEAFPLGQTLLHASNHTTHHRGELCCGLTALGSAPESVDLIDFMRASVIQGDDLGANRGGYLPA
jgi:uncharacterized damage-inducible protein DinB